MSYKWVCVNESAAFAPQDGAARPRAPSRFSLESQIKRQALKADVSRRILLMQEKPESVPRAVRCPLPFA